MKRMIRTMAVVLLAMILFSPVQALAADGGNGLKTDMEDGEYSI